jgi:hypothetical protein
VLPSHSKAAEGIGLADAWAKGLPAYAPRYPSPEHRRGYELVRALSENHRIGELDMDYDYHLLRDSELRTEFAVTEDQMMEAQGIVDACTAEPPMGKLLDMGVTGDKRAAALAAMALKGAEKLGLIDDSSLSDGIGDACLRERTTRASRASWT